MLDEMTYPLPCNRVRAVGVGLALVLAVVCDQRAARTAEVSAAVAVIPANVSACFVPSAEDCAGRIVGVLDGARRSVRVQAYGFSFAPILAALVRAKARGVDVRVILDKSDDRAAAGGRVRAGGALAMARAGIPTWIDWQPSIAHNKIMIVDDHMVIGGSFNFTAAAEHRNAENVTFIDSPVAAGRFAENWQSRRDQARPFVAAN